MFRSLINRIKRLEGKHGEEDFHIIKAQYGEQEAAIKKYKAEHPDAKGLFVVVLRFSKNTD